MEHLFTFHESDEPLLTDDGWVLNANGDISIHCADIGYIVNEWVAKDESFYLYRKDTLDEAMTYALELNSKH
jgi:hypothetical protein